MEQSPIALPQATTERLETFRSRVRWIKVAEGIFAGLFGLAASYVAVFLLDRVYDTPALLRGSLLLAGSLGFGLFFPYLCHRWIWGTRRMEQVAQLIKHKYPRLGDQLLGVVELARQEHEWKQSSTLARAAISQVDILVQNRDFSDAVPNPRHRLWAKTAAVPLTIMLLALILVPSAGTNALARWLKPWEKVERYTFTQINPLPEKLIVPHGEEFSLEASLTPDSRWSPAVGTTYVASLNQQWQASQTKGRYQFQLPPLTQETALHLSIGDVRETMTVTPATRPELESLHATITLPEYLKYTHPVTTDVRGGVVSILTGASASFQATVNRSLVEAACEQKSLRVLGNGLTIPARHVESSQSLPLTWKDELGLTPLTPFELKIQSVDDEKPSVVCQQTEPQQIVLSTDVITFEVKATDDYGLQRIGLEWKGIADPLHNPNPESGEKIVAAGHPEQVRLEVAAVFSAESDQVRPQILEIRAFAEDYHPEAHRAYSSPYLIHVMSPEDHAVWISEQLRRWVSRAEDVYEEEIRLHDANRELRRMPAVELARPETQRRIEQQATAERANAVRLGGVTDQGEQLLKQALRNPEMLVGHLDLWAGALKKLRQISEEQMPSVADLLQTAKNSPTLRSQKNSSSAPTAPSAGQQRRTQAATGETKPDQKSIPAVPTINNTESGFEESQTKPGDSKPKKPSSGKLGLPQTVLNGGPPSKPKPEPPESPAQEELDKAVETQADLLTDFAKIREELQAILDDLENSTFVKRFKAASRKQLEVAKSLNRTLFKGFGVSTTDLAERQTNQLNSLAESEVAQSRNVWTIQSDLEAYFGRKQEAKMQRILEEMRELAVVTKLNELGERVSDNRPGESISHAEFWADTLDRWGEELVSPSNCGACKGCKGESLPPSIILEVMRILEGEIDLRDETRALEQAKTGIQPERYDLQAKQQSETQKTLKERVKNVCRDIRALPEGGQKFARELNLLAAAGAAMQDAVTLLYEPTTGSATIAAETEVIELLLQSKRANPKGGGGGGGSQPGGGGTGETDESALALYGPGHDPQAKIQTRELEQMSGKTSSGHPEEFREGLDSFFHALEQQR